MAVGLMSIVAGLVTMLSSSWTVLPVAAVVALATWIWWSRGRSREAVESPDGGDGAGGSAGASAPEEGGRGSLDAAAVKDDSEKANVLEVKETELTVDVQQSPVNQKSVASEPKVISDPMVSDQREMDLAPALSNKQDWPAVEQISNKIQTELITPTSGESPVHNTCVTEYNLGQEKRHVCEKIKPTEVLNKSLHEDEALDLVSAVDQKSVSTDDDIIIQTNKVSSESNADMPSNFNTIETEIEKDKRKNFKLVFKDESERTATSPESENMTKKVAAVSPLPLNNISVSFNVHYMTCSNSQILAVTGNHECLGQWENYVPLKPNKDGFWSNSILLPVNSRFEWKYVVVENGKIWRWEECPNRCLETSHEDVEMYQCWGYH